jgi:hypothetical protein
VTEAAEQAAEAVEVAAEVVEVGAVVEGEAAEAREPAGR